METTEYGWHNAEGLCTNDYLADPVLAILKRSGAQTVLDLGCGNGSLSALLAEHGFEVAGLDSSESGIALANQHYPKARFFVHDIADPLPEAEQIRYGAAVATEVIEHLLLPRQLLDRAREALRPGGLFIVTTPYHGYLKNLLIALTGKWDSHHDPLWDFGHVKFFSRATLTKLFEQSGFQDVAFETAGRIPALAKSMIVSGKRA